MLSDELNKYFPVHLPSGTIVSGVFAAFFLCRSPKYQARSLIHLFRPHPCLRKSVLNCGLLSKTTVKQRLARQLTSPLVFLMSHSEHDLSDNESSPDLRSRLRHRGNGLSRGIFQGIDSHVATARTGWSKFTATCKSIFSKLSAFLQSFDSGGNGRLV